MRRDTGDLANEAFTLNLIVFFETKLSGLKAANCIALIRCKCRECLSALGVLNA